MQPSTASRNTSHTMIFAMIFAMIYTLAAALCNANFELSFSLLRLYWISHFALGLFVEYRFLFILALQKFAVLTKLVLPTASMNVQMRRKVLPATPSKRVHWLGPGHKHLFSFLEKLRALYFQLFKNGDGPMRWPDELFRWDGLVANDEFIWIKLVFL